MLKVFYQPKWLKKEQRSSPAPIYTAFLSIVLCMICLAGTTWAWFTANQQVGMAPLSAAGYTVDVTVTDGASTLTGTSHGNMHAYTLPASGTYHVTLTPSSDSTATTGYCLISIDGTVYYTPALPRASSFSFTYQSGIAVPDGLTKAEYDDLLANTAPTNLTIAWYWGTYPNTIDPAAYSADPGYVLLENGAVLGAAPGDAPMEAELTFDLTDFDLDETENTIPLLEDYRLVLTPDAGYKLPEIVTVEIDDVVYEVYTDGLEHREIPLDENDEPDITLLPPMPTFAPATNTLTIPAVLLTENVHTVTIQASAVEIEEPECNCETECTDLNGDCPVCKDSLDGCLGEPVEAPTEEPDPTDAADPAEEPDPTEETNPTDAADPAATEASATEPDASSEATDPTEE